LTRLTQLTPLTFLPTSFENIVRFSGFFGEG
jgi:hypothetical protein